MTNESGPYLREDLVIGRSARVKINLDFPYRKDVPQRLLETLDELYLLLDEKTEALENLSRTGIKLRHQEIELRREIHNLKRTTFQHKDLPEDVQALREEAASWKDEYASVLGLAKSLQTRVDDLDGEVTRLRASRKKWRRRARRADRVVVEQAEAIREGMAQEARNTADMKRSNEALQRRICLEGDDHRLTIRLAAEGFQEWLREEKIISAANHGDLTAEYLRGDVAVTEINQAKRELL